MSSTTKSIVLKQSHCPHYNKTQLTGSCQRGRIPTVPSRKQIPPPGYLAKQTAPFSKHVTQASSIVLVCTSAHRTRMVQQGPEGARKREICAWERMMLKRRAAAVPMIPCFEHFKHTMPIFPEPEQSWMPSSLTICILIQHLSHL